MKKIIIAIATIAIFVGCKTKQKESDQNKQTSTSEIPVQTAPAAVDTTTTTKVDTNAVSNTIVIDSNAIPEYAKDYPIIEFNTNIPIKLYASDNWVAPSDSILQLSGITIKTENKRIIISTDSSIIPQDITITYKKGKALVTQYGRTKEYNAKRVAIEDGVVLIDNMPVLPEKTLTILEIGVPGYTSIVLNGNSSLSSAVTLGNVDIVSTGTDNSIVLSEVYRMNNVNLKGNTSLSVDKARIVNKILVADSANVILKNCDSIYSATVTQKGKIQLPEKTQIIKEKTSGNGDIVKQ